jgi:hypothetical protein
MRRSLLAVAVLTLVATGAALWFVTAQVDGGAL